MSDHFLADDLSGALDAAAAFHQAGRRGRVVLSTSDWTSCDPDEVSGVTTETRHASAEVASATVGRAVAYGRAQGARLVYKKIDSTLRGPVAAELEAVAAAIPDSRFFHAGQSRGRSHRARWPSACPRWAGGRDRVRPRSDESGAPERTPRFRRRARRRTNRDSRHRHRSGPRYQCGPNEQGRSGLGASGPGRSRACGGGPKLAPRSAADRRDQHFSEGPDPAGLRECACVEPRASRGTPPPTRRARLRTPDR